MAGIITFNGKNDKLFSRVAIENPDPKTSIVVPETHYAILIKDGEMLQTFSQGKYLLDDLIEFKKDEVVTLEILYISKTAKLKLLWGTPNKITVAEPNLKQSYRIGMSGDFEVQVSDPRKCFLYLVGAEDGLTADALQDRLQSMVVSVVEEVLTSFIDERKIEYTTLFHHKQDISKTVMPRLSNEFSSAYGISVSAFNITNIIFDEEDIKKLKGDSAADTQRKEVPTPPQRQEGKFCVMCGAKLSENAKFCAECGARVADKSICPKCGSKVPDGAKFCPECGEKLI